MSDDINVNEIADQLNQKMDLDMHNVPNNIDFVIESKLPTASDNVWYRIYKSGFVEMGGVTASSQGKSARTVTLPITMANTEYTLTMTPHSGGSGSTRYNVFSLTGITTSTFTAKSEADESQRLAWRVSGMKASS